MPNFKILDYLDTNGGVDGMISTLLDNNAFFRLLFEAMPVGVLLVDANRHIQSINPEGNKIFCIEPNLEGTYRVGEQLRCINAQGKCGSAAACETCILRTSTVSAINGQSVARNKGKFFSYDGTVIKQYTLLVTAKQLVYREESLALLLIEDVSLVTELCGLIPICSSCHHIRDDKGNWVYLAEYLREHSEADLTHDYCPDCAGKLRPMTNKAESR
jgi:PAS domain-containing protein